MCCSLYDLNFYRTDFCDQELINAVISMQAEHLDVKVFISLANIQVVGSSVPNAFLYLKVVSISIHL